MGDAVLLTYILQLLQIYRVITNTRRKICLYFIEQLTSIIAYRFLICIEKEAKYDDKVIDFENIKAHLSSIMHA